MPEIAEREPKVTSETCGACFRGLAGPRFVRLGRSACAAVGGGLGHGLLLVGSRWPLAALARCAGRGNGALYPVLKHGPRSLTRVRVRRWQTSVRNESDDMTPL